MAAIPKLTCVSSSLRLKLVKQERKTKRRDDVRTEGGKRGVCILVARRGRTGGHPLMEDIQQLKKKNNKTSFCLCFNDFPS